MSTITFCALLCIFCLQKVSGTPSVCPEIVTRSQWGARPPIEIFYMIRPVQYVIIHHTATSECSTKNACEGSLQSMQNYHMEVLGYDDIKYNFLIGADGLIFEGRGWHKVGTHARKYDARSIGIAFIGNFSSGLPMRKQLQALKDFLQCGVELGEISENYKLFGARQVKATQSPGLKLFREIKKWPHFTLSPPKF